jgi:uncharacterized protein (DUF927 family)
MMARTAAKAKAYKYDLLISGPVNGKVGRATFLFTKKRDGKTAHADKAHVGDAKDRDRLIRRAAPVLRVEEKRLRQQVEEECRRFLDDAAKAQAKAQADAAAESAEGAAGASDAWQGVTLPAGYAMSAAGCVLSAANGSPQKLTRTPVWAAAYTRDHRYGGWGVLLEWDDRDGKHHQAAFPAGRLHEQGLSLVQELADGGLAVVPGCERDLLRYLAAFDTPARFRSVPRLGWVEAPAAPGVPGVPTVYVLPGEIIGDVAGERLVYQPEGHLDTDTSRVTAGTLKAWQEAVAGPTTGNPVLLFGLSCAFAAPLLRFANLEGGGFQLHGQSSRGKTTALQVAASVWGNGADPAEAPGASFIRKWNSTANAVEALAAAHNDGLLALDEIGEADLRDFGRMVYQLAGGQGKARLNRDAQLRQPRTWRVVILSTGETPACSALESEGRRARGGQLVRLVDIPARSGDAEIVQDAHGETPAALVGSLKRACATYYGTAGPAFLRALCAEGAESLGAKVRRSLDEAHARLLSKDAKDAPAEVGRVVRRFALVEAAGRLAVGARVLPQSEADIQGAVKEVFERWLAAYGKGGEMGRAVAQLRDFLFRHQARFRARQDAKDVVPNLAGYRDQPAGLFLLTPGGMREALEGFSVQDVARYLRDRSLLVCNESDRLVSSHRVEGVEHHVRLYAVRDEILDAGDSSAGTAGTAGTEQRNTAKTVTPVSPASPGANGDSGDSAGDNGDSLNDGSYLEM